MWQTFNYYVCKTSSGRLLARRPSNIACNVVRYENVYATRERKDTTSFDLTYFWWINFLHLTTTEKKKQENWERKKLNKHFSQLFRFRGSFNQLPCTHTHKHALFIWNFLMLNNMNFVKFILFVAESIWGHFLSC